MVGLSKTQREFLLDTFFKSDKYPGWKNIANNLLDDGESIVAGSECIWRGGVGNFITTTKTNKYVGCLKYEFDLEYFMTSEYYKEYRNYHLKGLKTARDKAVSEYNDIMGL